MPDLRTVTLTTVSCLALAGSIDAQLWTPADITTTMWLDAADAGTISVNGTNGVTQWNDKSGNNFHVAESTHNPNYNATGWSNGLGQLEFDIYNGATRAHTLGRDVTADGISGTAYTLFLVLNARQAEGDNEGWPHTARDTNGKENRFQINANGLKVRSDGSNGGSASGAYVAGEQILQFTLDSTASEVRRNGSQIAADNGTFTPAPLTGDFTINGRNSGDGHAGTEGDFAEWIYLAYNPDQDTRERIEGYLAHKWGLEGTLPANHPYKSTAPGGAVLGDFDGDGDVDGVDIAEMFSNFNGPGGGVPTNPATDLDSDGDVDGVDIATLFGAFTGPSAPATVPEPTSLALLGLLTGGLLSRRRTHKA